MSRYEPLHRIREELTQAGLVRKYSEVEPGPDAKRVVINGREARMFCTNDYLGLSRNPDVISAMQEVLVKYGCGAGGSRYLGGTRQLHHRLEQSLAAFHDKSEAVLYTNGYMANLGAISALAHQHDIIFSDAANHASIIDGIRMSKAKAIIWRHNDVDHLRYLLKTHTTSAKRIVVCESLYSMDGDFAPLEAILQVAHEHGCLTYVDEIHAVGLYGSHGEGYASQLGIADQVDILMSGTGKALGTLGGYVACNDLVAAILKSQSRPFIFTTSLPPVVLAATLRSLDLVILGADLRLRVHRNAALLRKLLQEHEFDYLNSHSHIFPIVTGGVECTRAVTERLLSKGIFAQGVGYPSVPMDKGRLRITVTPQHDTEDIGYLVQCLREVRDEVEEFGKLQGKSRVTCPAAATPFRPAGNIPPEPLTDRVHIA